MADEFQIDAAASLSLYLLRFLRLNQLKGSSAHLLMDSNRVSEGSIELSNL